MKKEGGISRRDMRVGWYKWLAKCVAMPYNRSRIGAYAFAGLVGLLTISNTHSAFGETVSANVRSWVAHKIGGDAKASTVNWCGDSENVVWQGVTTGIHLYDRATGKERIITEVKSDSIPFCSSDGRFVFYRVQGSRGLYALDIVLNKITSIDCAGPDISFAPNMQLAVTTEYTPTCSSIRMPWGRSIPVHSLSNAVQKGFRKPLARKWLSDSNHLVLQYISDDDRAAIRIVQGQGYPSGTGSLPIAIFDLAKQSLARIQDLPRRILPKIRITQNDTRLYFVGEDGVAAVNSIYLVDMKESPLRARNLNRSVESLDVHDDRGLLVKERSADLLNREASNLHLLTLDGRPRTGEGVENQLWDELVGFAKNGNEILVLRRDLRNVSEGPYGPPITSSVYLLIYRGMPVRGVN